MAWSSSPSGRSPYEALQNRVLVDEDCKFAEMNLDRSPDRDNEFRQVLGIDRDCACDIPPDIDEREPKAIWADLGQLASGVRQTKAFFRKKTDIASAARPLATANATESSLAKLLDGFWGKLWNGLCTPATKPGICAASVSLPA